MRWVLRIIGGVFVAFLVVLVALFTLPLLPVAQDAVTAGPYRTHLQDNRVVADETLQLQPGAYQPGFVMLGELHGFAKVQEMDLLLATHLAQRANMRWYLAELDPVQADIVNHYLETGNEAPLRAVFDGWADETAQWANGEFFAKLAAVRDFNRANPETAIYFIGLDRPQNDGLFNDWRAREPMTDSAPASLDAPSYETARAINAALGARHAAQAEGAGRYGYILDAVDYLSGIDGFERQTFYGLWGIFHTLKTRTENSEPLARRLHGPEGVFAGQVTTILSVCVADCFNLMPALALPQPLRGERGEPYTILPMGQDNAYMVRARGVGEVIDAMGEENAVLFRLAGDNSPYQRGTRIIGRSGYLTAAFPFKVEGPTAQAVDYLLALRGSEALTPWRGDAYDIARR